jgi:oxygen-dependent protoporphyrinogen oxidase
VRIVVIGGGVAGLCAAWRARTLGAEVVVLEASSRLGGQILTEHVSGCLLEHGAEGFVANSEALHAVCTGLDLAGDVISQTTTRALLAEGGALLELPPGEAGRRLGIQARTSDWGRGLQSLRGGMSSLVEALAGAIGSHHIKLGTPVEAIEPMAGEPSGGWRIHLPSAASFEAEGVIVALPGTAAGRMLQEVDPGVAGWLRRLETVSSLSVTLVVATDQVGHSLDATGFVVGETAAPAGLRACSFSSTKFAGRSGPGRCILRAFYRPPADGVESPKTWVRRTQDYLAKVIGLKGEAGHTRVVSWPSAIPRYASDHEATMAASLESLQCRGRIALAGAAVARSGLDGAVSSGWTAAEAVLLSRSRVTTP